MSHRARLIAALLIPVIGIAALMVRAELRTSSDRVWQVPVEGYDPRDLLAGQYLRYRYLWGDQKLQCAGGGVDCCICLAGAERGRAATPRVHVIDCPTAKGPAEPTAGCDDVVRVSLIHGPQRFYIDERYAKAAETAMQERSAAVELVVTPEGGVAVRELLFDGLPWREVLGPQPMKAAP